MRPGTVTSLPEPTPVRATSDIPALDARQQQALLHRIFDKQADVPFMARFAVINLIGLALVGAAWAQDLLSKPYAADASHMCYLITVLFVIGLICVFRKDWQSVRWVGNTLVYLGMVGTVVGLIMTVSDLTVDKAQNFESFKTLITAIYVGSGTALYTNLLACIFYLWLGTNAHLLARQEV
jgi:NADH:ubiquinone oxidoreductase subunit 2 (subunit N)